MEKLSYTLLNRCVMLGILEFINKTETLSDVARWE